MSLPKTYGLIGYPVKHSLSPLMHNAAFSATAINAEYKLFEIKAQELEGFLRSVPDKNICGFNITVPYKEKIIPFLDELLEEARLVGAVNTVRVSQGRLEGHNTDGAGFSRHLREDLKFNPQGKKIAVMGAGGAARALTVYLAQTKPESISIYDVDKAKSANLIQHLKDSFKNIKFRSVSSITGLDILNCDLLVNATPIGMKETDPSLVDINFIHPDLLVYDLIYNPSETKLLKLAREKGAKVSNGLGMLLYQGALSFELWTQKKAPIEIMRKALEEGVKNL